MKATLGTSRTRIADPCAVAKRRAARLEARELPTYCRGRELHLVDVENLLGGASVTETAVRDLRDRFDRVVASPTRRSEPHQVVATSTWHTLAAVGFGWTGARLVFEEGADGADRALLDAGDWCPETRFSRVVIGSGDHIFAAYARRLRQAGADVVVVSRPEALARELRQAATRVISYSDLTSLGSPA